MIALQFLKVKVDREKRLRQRFPQMRSDIVKTVGTETTISG